MSFENRDEDKTVADSPQGATAGEQEVMRPIPDGGLQHSMPEWLRRPPAWRNLPQRDELVPSPVSGAHAPVAKELPVPDTSEIDPRSLVEVADLPQWLQEIAARSDARAAGPVMITSGPPMPQPADTPKEPGMSDTENRNPVEVGTERSVPFEPVDKRFRDIPDQETKTYGGGPPKRGTNPIIIGIIALAVIIVLILLLMAIT